MRFVTYVRNDGNSFGEPSIGAVVADRVIDLPEASSGQLPRTVVELLAMGPEGLDIALEAVQRREARTMESIPLQDVRLLAPIPNPPRNVICVGWNYVEHFEEGQGKRLQGKTEEMPEHPNFFTKLPTTVVGPNAPVQYTPYISRKLDWEVELAVIIGRTGRDIPAEDAMRYVFGYTIANDVSVRDVQHRKGNQWFKGKSFDSTCPLGPWIVTADEIPDPYDLRLILRVNGEVKQDSNTRHMYFRIPRIVEELSAGTTIVPGDIILTGTPSGVGFARNPPEYLQPGDVMEAEIQDIGVLRNPVGEPQQT